MYGEKGLGPILMDGKIKSVLSFNKTNLDSFTFLLEEKS